MPDTAAIAEDLTDDLPEGDALDGQAAATAEGDESGAVDEGAQGAEASAEEGAADELVVTLGDETPPEEDERAAPAWVKDLRKQNRELVRKTRDLEARLQQTQPAPAAVVLGPKPTLASCEYDEDKFASEMEAWHERKAKADEQQREAQRAQQAQADAWQKRLAEYQKQKTALRVPGIEQAEETIRDTFNTVQQGLLIRACKQPALMVAALGNNERKARDLAAITDPVEFVAELVRLETTVKTQARKPTTVPERTVPRSSVSGAAAVDNQLSKLQAEAAKTGDRTKVVAYLRGKQQAA